MLRRPPSRLPATVELTVDRVEDPPIRVYADETHLQQMVLNLAINARDAMPDGGSLRIRIAHVPIADAGPLAETSADAAGFARLQVIDTGTGMSPEIMDRIFDPFFTTKPRGQGTGLGLSITRSIVEEHGGHLVVESAPGRGTTFTFTMPCVIAEMESNEAAAPVDVRGHGELILVVEDYQPVRALVVAALRARGYQAVAVADGQAALCEYDRHRTQVRALILDLDVPKCSGCDVLRTIRANGSGVPVIVITGRVEAGLEQSLDSRSTVLRKPFRVADLVDHLSRQLHARDKTDALP
ncbi:MAG: response regulator [Phycisphaerae bacterium]|nr:response regulator [Phycisphaerae bacterium]